MLNHYDLLGVEPTADLDAIRHAWRVKVRLLHPDKHQGSPEDVRAEAASETYRVNGAWETLRDPERRRQYDLLLVKSPNGRAGGAVDPDGEMRVTCPLCKHAQRISTSAGRFDCEECAEAWQRGKCEGCYKLSTVRERRPNWRCVNCGKEQVSSWGGGARYVFCVRCKAGNEVEAGVDRFTCIGCGLEHLRCACGHYRSFPAIPWRSWRCPRCNRLNKLSPHFSFAIVQFAILVGAVAFVLLGILLLAGLLR